MTPRDGLCGRILACAKSSRLTYALSCRQEETHACSLTGLGIELNMAAGLLDEAVDHAEAKPCSRTGAFRGKEGLESVTLDLFGHADARVRDGNQDI